MKVANNPKLLYLFSSKAYINLHHVSTLNNLKEEHH